MLPSKCSQLACRKTDVKNCARCGFSGSSIHGAMACRPAAVLSFMPATNTSTLIAMSP